MSQQNTRSKLVKNPLILLSLIALAVLLTSGCSGADLGKAPTVSDLPTPLNPKTPRSILPPDIIFELRQIFVDP